MVSWVTQWHAFKFKHLAHKNWFYVKEIRLSWAGISIDPEIWPLHVEKAASKLKDDNFLHTVSFRSYAAKSRLRAISVPFLFLSVHQSWNVNHQLFQDLYLGFCFFWKHTNIFQQNHDYILSKLISYFSYKHRLSSLPLTQSDNPSAPSKETSPTNPRSRPLNSPSPFPESTFLKTTLSMLSPKCLRVDWKKTTCLAPIDCFK